MQGLYAILDPAFCKVHPPHFVAESVLQAGCAALQLRFKQNNDREVFRLANLMRQQCHTQGVPFFVNDRADIAALSGADGVHLGQSDVPVEAVQRSFPNLKIGLSTHSLLQVEQAMDLGVDYIGFGPIFETQSKQNPDAAVGLEELKQAVQISRVPVVAIGGIDPSNIEQVSQTQVPMVAAISAVCSAKNPQEVARKLHQKILESQ